jgi:hypothetical protein
MHTVLKTSFIPEVAVKLRRYGCRILGDRGLIDQKAGVALAGKEGFNNIAVTVCAFGDERLKIIRDVEKARAISIIILVVCTTGIEKNRLDEIEKYADIVWTCNSMEVRNRLSEKAIKILSTASPVYVLTKKGEKIISGYMPNVFGMRKEIERGAMS